MIGKKSEDTRPYAECPECHSHDIAVIGDICHLRYGPQGVDKEPDGFFAKCTRCMCEFCVTRQGVYRLFDKAGRSHVQTSTEEYERNHRPAKQSPNLGLVGVESDLRPPPLP